MQAAAMDTLVQQLPECCRSSSFTVQCGCGERWRVEEQSSFPGYNISLEQDYSKPLRTRLQRRPRKEMPRESSLQHSRTQGQHGHEEQTAPPLSLSLSPCV